MGSGGLELVVTRMEQTVRFMMVLVAVANSEKGSLKL